MPIKQVIRAAGSLSGSLALTEHRRAVFNAIKEARTPFTVRQLFHHLQKTHPAISRATIYRALNKFCSMKLVQQIPLSDRESICFCTDAPILAVIECPYCGDIRILDAEVIDSVSRQVTARHAMTPSEGMVYLRAACSSGRKQCSKKADPWD